VNDAGDTPLVVSDFTWQNQGSSTATDENGTIVMRAPAAAGENVRSLIRTAPSAPYSYIFAMQGIAVREGIQQFGVGFRQSSSSKMVVMHVLADGSEAKRVAVYKFNSSTSFNGSLLAVSNLLLFSRYIWFKIEDDNTNIKFSISFDGIAFIEIASEVRTTFLLTTGPDQIVWGINNQGSSARQMLARLFHWSRAS
jgi:hypothetical protein